jgi:hypothetical protein
MAPRALRQGIRYQRPGKTVKAFRAAHHRLAADGYTWQRMATTSKRVETAIRCLAPGYRTRISRPGYLK